MRVHDYEYIRRILDVVGSTTADEDKVTADREVPSHQPPGSCCGIRHLDGDTTVSPRTWEAALRAAGAACAAADAVVAGNAHNAFCAVRPPGHHAGPSGIVLNEHDAAGSHGFCVLNNVAIAAAYVRAAFGRPDTPYATALTNASGRSQGQKGNLKPVIRRVVIFDFGKLCVELVVAFVSPSR